MSNYNDDNRKIIADTCRTYSNDVIKEILLRLGLKENSDLVKILIKEKDDKKLKEYIQKIENYEYELNYPYNFIYKIKNAKEVIKLIKDDFYKYLFNNKNTDRLNYKLKEPTLIVNVDEVSFKFSIVLSGEKNRKIKLPIIVNLYEKQELALIKIRFIPRKEFKQISENSDFYIEQLREVKKWLKDKLSISIEKIDIFVEIIDLFKKSFFYPEQYPNIIAKSFTCNDKNRGNIRLKTNDKNMLPMLSSLRDLSNNFESENDKNKIKEYLENLINTSDYYKIGLEWIFEKKRLEIDFTKEYKNEEDTLIYLYDNSFTKEERENAIKDLEGSKNTIKK